MLKKIFREITIYSLILLIIIPAIVSAVLLTIKNVLWELPDELYYVIAERLDNG
jgi:hypothetical protein